MRITYNMVDLENSASTSTLHVLSELMPRIRTFTGKARKVDGSMTKAFKEAIPRDIELPVGVKGQWGLYIRSNGVELCVKVHGEDGLPSNEGYQSTYYAGRLLMIASLNSFDPSPSWYEDDELNTDQFSKMYDYWEMKRKYERAEELERKANDLRSEFRLITGYTKQITFC